MATIAVAGATGRLGSKIVAALAARGARVRAIVRPGTAREKLAALERAEVEIVPGDFAQRGELVQCCRDVACVVSALQGLREVIVDAQSALLEAAIEARVARFIPSDFAADFTKLEPGENRNFDLRRDFRERLLRAPIASTSVLGGAFTELLTYGMPLLDRAAHRVQHWGDAEQKLDFTTMDDTARVTAAAALDATTPAIVRVAGDQISPAELARVAGDVFGARFELVRLGELDALAEYIRRERAGSPASESEVFPRWQQAQYAHNMQSGRAKLAPLDNARYPEIVWATVRDVLSAATRAPATRRP